jgi:hypothetical protein
VISQTVALRTTVMRLYLRRGEERVGYDRRGGGTGWRLLLGGALDQTGEAVSDCIGVPSRSGSRCEREQIPVVWVWAYALLRVRTPGPWALVDIPINLYRCLAGDPSPEESVPHSV